MRWETRSAVMRGSGPTRAVDGTASKTCIGRVDFVEPGHDNLLGSTWVDGPV
jgi:hypothetical protein